MPLAIQKRQCNWDLHSFRHFPFSFPVTSLRKMKQWSVSSAMCCYARWGPLPLITLSCPKMFHPLGWLTPVYPKSISVKPYFWILGTSICRLYGQITYIKYTKIDVNMEGQNPCAT